MAKAAFTINLPLTRYTAGMIDDHQARPSALHGATVLQSLRAAAGRLPIWPRRAVPVPSSSTPCAWTAPPLARALPRNLDIPLSAYDPGAFGRCAPMSVAGFVDPMVLEQTLHRIPAL